MYKLLFLFFLLFSYLNAHIKNYNILPNSLPNTEIDKIRILDSVELNFSKYKGIKFREISAIVHRKGTLYALGDKGILYTLKLKIKNNKIKKLRLKKAVKLKDKNSKYLQKSNSDSEGLALHGKELLISYEGFPRVELRTGSGKDPQQMELHKSLSKLKNYTGLNKGLEALAYSEKYGIVTAPEEPLKGKRKKHILYSKDKKWKFKKDGSITSLEFINEDEIMILQREFNALSLRRKIVLSKLNLVTKEYTILAKLDSKKGWKLDNFEGLAKVADNRYLMISDDNDSIFQKTLLVLFELK